VIDSEPAAPRLLNPKIDRDLETICLKCLQKDGSRRYGRAQDLADDLGRYLRDEPILARPVGNVVRLWRWCKRKPWVASLAAAVSILVATVAVVSTAAYWRILHEQLATETQRKRAEKNSKLARGAVQDMLTRVADELLPDLPQNAQTEKTRLDLLNGALSYYQQFLDDNSDDPAMQREIASTLSRVGEIFRLLGDDNQSKQSFQKAIAIFQELMQKFPDSLEHAQGLAIAYNFLGELYRTGDQLELAEQSYREAIRLQLKLVAVSPQTEAYSTELARTRNNLGILLKDSSRPDEAAAEYEEAIALLTPLIDRELIPRDVLQGLARAHINHGVLLRGTKQPVLAEQAFGQGLDLMSQLVRAYPSRSQYQLELAAAYNNLGNLLVNDEKRRAEAADNYRRALEVFSRLADVSPTVPLYRRELANCCNNLATALKLNSKVVGQDNAELSEATSVWHRGQELAESLLAEKPDWADYHSIYGAIVGNLGVTALEQNDLSQAHHLLELAVEHEKTAFDSNPQNPTYRAFLRTDYWRLARTLIRLGHYRQSAQIARRLPELFPDTWQEYNRAAMLIAQCVPLAKMDENASDEQRATQVAEYASEVTELFRKAIERGYADWKDLKTNPTLDPLRDLDDFRRLMAELESKATP
jgi:eukaryotic-like serine/threonine-protein kinase